MSSCGGMKKKKKKFKEDKGVGPIKYGSPKAAFQKSEKRIRWLRRQQWNPYVADVTQFSRGSKYVHWVGFPFFKSEDIFLFDPTDICQFHEPTCKKRFLFLI